jgi:hypothetical protein
LHVPNSTSKEKPIYFDQSRVNENNSMFNNAPRKDSTTSVRKESNNDLDINKKNSRKDSSNTNSIINSNEKDKYNIFVKKTSKDDVPKFQINLDFIESVHPIKKIPTVEINALTLNSSFMEDDELFNKRDDLLHKKNLDCLNEVFKKIRVINLEVGIEEMINDMNFED